MYCNSHSYDDDDDDKSPMLVCVSDTTFYIPHLLHPKQKLFTQYMAI